MRRLSAVLLALCLGALSAFAMACGEDREGLISASRSSDLQAALDRIDRDVSQRECGQVLDDHLASLRREVEDLPGSVDRELRQRLREGLEALETQAPDDCRGDTTETEPETTPETVPETIPEETVPEEVPQETVPPETTPPETTPAPAPEPETPTPEEPPPPSGGEEAPQGNNRGNGNGNGALEEDG